MSKESFITTITTDDKQVSEAVEIMFSTFTDNMADLLVQIAANRGFEIEPKITVEDGAIYIEKLGGFPETVITLTEGKPAFQKYEDVTEDSVYAFQKKNAFITRLKTSDDTDPTIGHFRDLDGVITGLDSDEVAEAVKKLKEENKS